jgi:hypothetical protein
MPVEALLGSSSRPPRIIRNLVIVLFLLAAAGGGVFFSLRLSGNETAAADVEVKAPAAYVMDGPFLERRFYRGDTILVPLGESQYKIEVTNLGEAVTLGTPGGAVMLDLGQEVLMDLNTDGLGDLRITAADFVKNEPVTGAALRFDIENTGSLLSGGSGPAEDGTGIDEASGITPGAAAGAAVPVIFSSPNAYPFTLQAVFQGYCMYRWEIIAERDRRDRNEQYFQRGDELNIQAQNGIRMWISNAAAVKIDIIGGGRTVPLEIGGAGEVVVADVRWVRDDDGRFRLVLLRLE